MRNHKQSMYLCIRKGQTKLNNFVQIVNILDVTFCYLNYYLSGAVCAVCICLSVCLSAFVCPKNFSCYMVSSEQTSRILEFKPEELEG